MKNYLKSIGITFGLILIMSLFINIFYFYDLINNFTYKIILIIVNSLIVSFSAYLLGKKADEKGYLEGLKFGSIISILMFLISIIFFKNISIYMLIYYLIIIISSMIGSTIGINNKKE